MLSKESVLTKSKQKHTPSPRLPKSEDKRAANARLAASFTIVVDGSGPARLSVERAAALVSRMKDEPSMEMRAHREKRARAAEAIEDAGVRRRFLAEQREIDRGIARFWRALRTKVRKQLAARAVRDRPPRNSLPSGSIKLPKYSGAVLDRLGRQSVYMAVRYYGARRTRVGVARRLVVYIVRDDAIERDVHGQASIFSNVGDDLAEQAMAFDLVETLNRSAQGNAKVVFSMIVNLPHDIGVEARREILAQFCHEAFGLHDLPFVASVHEAPEAGDARNTHGHIIFALRPVQRTAPYEWEVGRELATEFDCKERFTHYRRLFAQVMTEVVQDKGKQRVYTHLSNAARGLANKPLVPLGPGKTAMARRREYVPDVERNRAEIARSEGQMEDERSERRLAKVQATIDELRDVRAAMIDRKSMAEVQLDTGAPRPILPMQIAMSSTQAQAVRPLPVEADERPAFSVARPFETDPPVDRVPAMPPISTVVPSLTATVLVAALAEQWASPRSVSLTTGEVSVPVIVPRVSELATSEVTTFRRPVVETVANPVSHKSVIVVPTSAHVNSTTTPAGREAQRPVASAPLAAVIAKARLVAVARLETLPATIRANAKPMAIRTLSPPVVGRRADRPGRDRPLRVQRYPTSPNDPGIELTVASITDGAAVPVKERDRAKELKDPTQGAPAALDAVMSAQRAVLENANFLRLAEKRRQRAHAAANRQRNTPGIGG